MNEGPLVLFDGVCNFCNYWVNFAIRHNKKNDLRFTPLQGESAKSILPDYSINPTQLNSVIFVNNGKAYTQSSAALQICRHLNGGWKLFYGFYIIPKFIRDFLYNIIARNRYRWFGRKDQCMVPTGEMRSRFLP
jgi:predicted DCC family thiol-disulfide oxidoreductase YuxK